MNCSIICKGFAPTALRTPISRVRSLTDTSIIFIMPTPAATKAMIPIIKPNMVSVGDVIIGINSSGPHSNGYSIINQVFDFDNISNELIVDLLTPTKIYVNVIKELVSELDINGIAHITGGGITENIPRILPEYTTAYISLSSWDIPEVFWNIHEAANITLDELLRVFNCGIGMCIIVDKEDCDRALEIINNNNEVGTIIGNVIKSKNKSSEVLYGNW